MPDNNNDELVELARLEQQKQELLYWADWRRDLGAGGQPGYPTSLRISYAMLPAWFDCQAPATITRTLPSPQTVTHPHAGT